MWRCQSPVVSSWIVDLLAYVREEISGVRDPRWWCVKILGKAATWLVRRFLWTWLRPAWVGILFLARAAQDRTIARFSDRVSALHIHPGGIYVPDHVPPGRRYHVRSGETHRLVGDLTLDGELILDGEVVCA